MTRTSGEIDGRAANTADLDAVATRLEVGVVDGEVHWLAGPALVLYRSLIALFDRLGRSAGAVERHYPILISGDVLARTDYFRSFPHQASFAAHLDPGTVEGFIGELEQGEPFGKSAHVRLAPPARVLSPAVCYHCYAEHANTTLGADLTVISALGRCFRNEDSETLHPLARGREFTMHEIVFLGRADKVAGAREQMVGRVVELADSLGLRGHVVPAHDPFYGGTSAGRARQVLQEAAKLKLELRVDCGDRELAVASFNLHEDYFGRSFAIRHPDDAPIHSACIAFGIERWMRALLATRGVEAADWHRALAAYEFAQFG